MSSFNGKRILVTGATGLIGNSLVHKLMKFNNVHIVAVSRSEKKLHKCFSIYQNNPKFSFFTHDVSLPFNFLVYPIDYIFHANIHYTLFYILFITTYKTSHTIVEIVQIFWINSYRLLKAQKNKKTCVFYDILVLCSESLFSDPQTTQ